MSTGRYRHAILGQGLEQAVRHLRRQHTRDRLRMSRMSNLLPGAPIAGGELRRSVIDAVPQR